MEIKKLKKNLDRFICESCDFKCYMKCDWDRHILRRKHLANVNGNNWNFKEIKKLTQDELFCACGKKYQTSSGLWKHKKTCLYKEQSENNEEKDNEENTLYMITSLFQEQLKENKELKELLLEQNNKFLELLEAGKLGSNNTNHINSHNKTKFNLNFFLNEQCKDALNITDFVNELQVKITDLENVGKLGYVEGISKIFINGLKKLDITKRPLHCTDLKREVLYVKDQDSWEKENDENKKIKKAIHCIGTKNIQQIPIWTKENPNCKDSESRKNDQYLQILNQSMGGVEPSNIEKIIHNISKEVVVDKK